MSPELTWAERPLTNKEAITTKAKKKKETRLQFANAHRDKDLNFWSGLMKLRLNCLAKMINVIWRKKEEACKPIIYWLKWDEQSNSTMP